MKRVPVMPIVMGAVMGPVMLWMAHDMLTGQAAASSGGLTLFVLAHGVGVLILVAAGARLGRRFAPVRRFLAHHSISHVSLMLASAAVAAGLVHLLHVYWLGGV